MTEVGVGTRLPSLVPPLAESREAPARRRERQPASDRGQRPRQEPAPPPPPDGRPHIDEVV
jgi:hypothetical protein